MSTNIGAYIQAHKIHYVFQDYIKKKRGEILISLFKSILISFLNCWKYLIVYLETFLLLLPSLYLLLSQKLCKINREKTGKDFKPH